MFERSNAFPLHRYADPIEATIKDLIGPAAYLSLVDRCYGMPRRLRLSRTLHVASDAPVLKEVSNHLASNLQGKIGFHSMAPAEYLLTGQRKFRKLPGIEHALTRFEQLFNDLA
jgi:hypothetical protein